VCVQITNTLSIIDVSDIKAKPTGIVLTILPPGNGTPKDFAPNVLTILLQFCPLAMGLFCQYDSQECQRCILQGQGLAFRQRLRKRGARNGQEPESERGLGLGFRV